MVWIFCVLFQNSHTFLIAKLKLQNHKIQNSLMSAFLFRYVYKPSWENLNSCVC